MTQGLHRAWVPGASPTPPGAPSTRPATTGSAGLTLSSPSTSGQWSPTLVPLSEPLAGVPVPAGTRCSRCTTEREVSRKTRPVKCPVKAPIRDALAGSPRVTAAPGEADDTIACSAVQIPSGQGDLGGRRLSRGRSSMAEPQPSKLVMRVRFPSPAPRVLGAHGLGPTPTPRPHRACDEYDDLLVDRFVRGTWRITRRVARSPGPWTLIRLSKKGQTSYTGDRSPSGTYSPPVLTGAGVRAGRASSHRTRATGTHSRPRRGTPPRRARRRRPPRAAAGGSTGACAGR
ncbi:hypothetical protein BH20ACT9_BH20ACT9_15180 [soil metagenome]